VRPLRDGDAESAAPAGRHDRETLHERQGLLERTVENSYLATDADNEDPMNILLGHAITYRIAVGPQTGRKVFA
jgi:hypothetical protein